RSCAPVIAIASPASSIRAMTMASMFRSDLMALRLNYSASSRRSSSVRTSRTWSGTGDGFAHRATASLAAAAGSRTVKKSLLGVFRRRREWIDRLRTPAWSVDGVGQSGHEPDSDARRWTCAYTKALLLTATFAPG